MDLVENKASGRHFIVLEDAGDGRFRLITPEGKIKRLERRLFDPPVQVDPEVMGTEYCLTQPQVARYENHTAE